MPSRMVNASIDTCGILKCVRFFCGTIITLDLFVVLY